MTEDYKRPQQLPIDMNIVEEICAHIAEGGTLIDILAKKRGQKGWPVSATFYEWLRNDRNVSALYQKAREAGAEAIAEDCLRIADTDVEMTGEGGSRKRDAAYIAWQKLRIDTRLRLLSKWSPHRYGDRTTVAGDPDAPLSAQGSVPITELVEAIFAAQEAAAKGQQ